MATLPNDLSLPGGAVDSRAPAPKTCDLCGGRQFHLISQFDRKREPLDTGLCALCGLVTHWNIPSETELDEFYATRYRQAYHGERTPSARRVMRAWRNGERIFGQLKPFLRPGESVFEVGAGIGCTVKVFQHHGWTASGIEPNSGFEEFSRTRLKADVRSAYLFDLPPIASHDVVLLIHVIEHLRSPREALERLHRLIKPGGRLYVECPNIGAPFATQSRLFHFAHIHNFTALTLSMLARRCGFVVEKQFSGANDPNLQLLLRRSSSRQILIDADSCRQTLAALNRYNKLTYHLRWNYLAPRAIKLASYLRERLTAQRFVRRLLQQGGGGRATNSAAAA